MGLAIVIGSIVAYGKVVSIRIGNVVSDIHEICMGFYGPFAVQEQEGEATNPKVRLRPWSNAEKWTLRSSKPEGGVSSGKKYCERAS